MIFQDPYQTLNPRQRVRAIVTEPLVVQGIASSEREGRVGRALEGVGLEPSDTSTATRTSSRAASASESRSPPRWSSSPTA